MSPSFIYLASQSPRRTGLLKQLGLRFEVVNAPADENLQARESPQDYVLRAARQKVAAAVQGLGGHPSAPVLAADTVVVIDGVILRKPCDRGDALTMLARLSGRSHEVLSGLALWTPVDILQALSTSRVNFRAITPEEMAAYWDSGEPADKAGGYAIQGLGALFVERLEGSYSGVMGLPLFETAQLLRAAGIAVLGGDQSGEGVRK
ncbi:MAG: Maf family protein [Gammaproteobacteria bacterium]